MKSWLGEQLQILQHLSEDKAIRQTAFELTHELGFDYLSFDTAFRTRLPMDGISNLPSAWTARYRYMGWARIDPILNHCHQSVQPVLWNDQLFAATPHFRDDAWDHGIRHGLSLAVHDARGHVSVLSLTRRNLAVTTDEFCIKGGHSLRFCNLLHQGLGEKWFEAQANLPGRLSCREREVLRWLAEGKTASEVALILNISERTVNFHTNSAVKKTGQPNKTSAIIHAAKTGLL